MDPCTFPVMHTLSIGLYPFRKGLWTPAHFWTWKLCPLTYIPPGWGSRVFIHRPLHIFGHGNSICWPVSLQGGAPEFLSTDPCTFLDMGTPSIGLYPSREGLWSFYPWIPAHFQTWKLHPLAMDKNSSAPPWRDMGQWMEFPCPKMCRELWIKTPHFWTWKLRLLAHIPLGRGTRVFIHGSLHISGHGNSICWPVSLQGWAPEFLSIDPCTFPDMEALSIGPYPSREGHWSFYPWTPAHFWTWKLRLLAHIPPGRGTRVFILRSVHISGHG